MYFVGIFAFFIGVQSIEIRPCNYVNKHLSLHKCLWTDIDFDVLYLNGRCFNNFHEVDTNCFQVSTLIREVANISQNSTTTVISWTGIDRRNITFDLSYYINVRLGYDFTISDYVIEKNGKLINNREPATQIILNGLSNLSVVPSLGGNLASTNLGNLSFWMVKNENCVNSSRICEICHGRCPLNYTTSLFRFTADGYTTLNMPIPIISHHECAICTEFSGRDQHKYFTFHTAVHGFDIEFRFDSIRKIKYMKIHLKHLCSVNSGVFGMQVIADNLLIGNITTHNEFYDNFRVFAHNVSIKVRDLVSGDGFCNHGSINFMPEYSSSNYQIRSHVATTQLCRSNQTCLLTDYKVLPDVHNIESCKDAVLNDHYCSQEEIPPYMNFRSATCKCILHSKCTHFIPDDTDLYSFDGLCLTNMTMMHMNKTTINNWNIFKNNELITNVPYRSGIELYLNLEDIYHIQSDIQNFSAFSFELNVSQHCEIELQIHVDETNVLDLKTVKKFTQNTIYMQGGQLNFQIQSVHDHSVLDTYRSSCHMSLKNVRYIDDFNNVLTNEQTLIESRSTLPSPNAPPNPPPAPLQCKADFLSATDLFIDGNIVSEIRLLLDLFLNTLMTNSLDSYTCKVQSNIRYECLDIASFSTLSGSLSNIDQSNIVDDDGYDLYNIVNSTVSGSSLYGSQNLCNGKRVGDGMINSYDLWVFIMTNFNLAPYDDVNIHSTLTVDGRDDTSQRCQTNITASEWMQGLYQNECQTNTDILVFLGRNANDMPSLNLQVDTINKYAEGRWVKIKIPIIIWAIEIHVSVSVNYYVPLSNMPFNGNIPFVSDRIQVQYKRYDEYDRRCASIIPSIFGNIAMIGNSIQLGQYGRYPCKFDVYIWLPMQYTEPLTVLSTSSAMDGNSGAVQMQDASEQGILEIYNAKISADPHLEFAHGGKADFRGHHKRIYNILSAYKCSVNVMFENTLFMLRETKVSGTFVTNTYLITNYDKELKISYNAFRVVSSGFAEMWCEQKYYQITMQKNLICGVVRVRMKYSSLHVDTPEWNVSVYPKPIYNKIAGPSKRLDIMIANNVPQMNMRHMPHGLLGQSFDNDDIAVFGLMETFSGLNYNTSFMADGAIEGSANDYMVANAFSHNFTYSRFENNGPKRNLNELTGFRAH